MSCGYAACVPQCTPSCSIPTYVRSCSPPISYPVGGLGSLSSCGGGLGYSGGALSSGGGGAVSAGSLGIVSGANVSCVSQTPPSQLVIQRAPVCVTLPGAILSTSCEPVRVGGYSACGGGGSIGGGSLSGSIVGIPAGSGRLGSSGVCRPYVSRRSSIGNVCCGSPC